MYELDIKGEAFNFSTETPTTVLEIVEKILKLMGREDLEPITQNEATNEIKLQYLSAKKARNLLGWSSGYSMAEGLKETINWYKHFLRQ